MDTKEFDARLKCPFNMILSGPSPSGKSTFIINLLKQAYNLLDTKIDYIVWFAGQKTNMNLHTFFPHILQVVEELPTDTFNEYILPDKHGVFVIDDMLSEASSSKAVMNLFIKVGHHNNITVILCLQDLFYNGKERKTFVRNAHYLVIFRNPLDYSIIYALGQKVLPHNNKVFLEIFKEATKTPYGYLFLDGHQSTIPEARFRSDILNKNRQIVYILD